MIIGSKKQMEVVFSGIIIFIIQNVKPYSTSYFI